MRVVLTGVNQRHPERQEHEDGGREGEEPQPGGQKQPRALGVRVGWGEFGQSSIVQDELYIKTRNQKCRVRAASCKTNTTTSTFTGTSNKLKRVAFALHDAA